MNKRILDEKYNSKSAALYRDKIATEAQGNVSILWSRIDPVLQKTFRFGMKPRHLLKIMLFIRKNLLLDQAITMQSLVVISKFLNFFL